MWLFTWTFGGVLKTPPKVLCTMSKIYLNRRGGESVLSNLIIFGAGNDNQQSQYNSDIERSNEHSSCHHPSSGYSYQIPTRPSSYIPANPMVCPFIILSRIDFLTILLEVSPAAPQQVASQQRPQVYVLVPRLPYRPKFVGMWNIFLLPSLLTSWTGSAALNEAVNTVFSILAKVEWNEEDMPHIIGRSRTLTSIAST